MHEKPWKSCVFQKSTRLSSFDNDPLMNSYVFATIPDSELKNPKKHPKRFLSCLFLLSSSHFYLFFSLSHLTGTGRKALRPPAVSYRESAMKGIPICKWVLSYPIGAELTPERNMKKYLKSESG